MDKQLITAIQNVLAGFTPDTQDREAFKRVLKEETNGISKN